MAILIAITGGSGSGKSTLAEALVSALPDGAAVLVREDSYYRDAASLPGFDAATFDFDDVAARDHDLMIRDLQALKAELDSIIDQCSCGTVADCRIIDSLSPKH